MTARRPHEDQQLPVPATTPKVPRGMWRRIAQATIRDLAYADMRIRQLEQELAAAKAAKGSR